MEARIRRNIIILAAVTSLIVIGMISAWTFMLHRPATAEYAKLSTRYETRKGVADGLRSALVDQARAERNREDVKKQIALYRERYRSFNFDMGADADSDDVKEAKREKTWRNLMNEYYSDYGVALGNELKAAANDSNVIIDTNVRVDAPPQTPEMVGVPSSGLLKPTGATPLSITLNTNYGLNSILQFFTRINQSNILMVVGNIKIEGTSPYLRCATTIQPYELANGPSVVLAAPPAPPAATTPEASGSTGAATGGGSAAPASPSIKKSTAEES